MKAKSPLDKLKWYCITILEKKQYEILGDALFFSLKNLPATMKLLIIGRLYAAYQKQRKYPSSKQAGTVIEEDIIVVQYRVLIDSLIEDDIHPMFLKNKKRPEWPINSI